MPIICENWWPNRIGRLTALPPPLPPVPTRWRPMQEGVDVSRHRHKRRGALAGASWPLSKELEDPSTGTSQSRQHRAAAALHTRRQQGALSRSGTKVRRENERQLQVSRAWVLGETSLRVVRLVSHFLWVPLGFTLNLWGPLRLSGKR